MEKALETIWGLIRSVLSPAMGKRREIRPGFQRENIPVWLCLMALYIVYQAALAGRTYELLAPHQVGWEWQKIPFPALDFAVSAGILLFASGISLFPATRHSSAR